tara:strand:+ start:106 stop:366 length:261 start_codon:yes stop_codon:yes gene_type:complete
MEYKGVKYEFTEWTTHSGEKASAFYCSDKTLLKEYNTVQFGAKTLDLMHEKIDYYIENSSKQKGIRELNMQAAQEFYSSMGEYKGD